MEVDKIPLTKVKDELSEIEVGLETRRKKIRREELELLNKMSDLVKEKEALKRLENAMNEEKKSILNLNEMK